MNDEPEIEDRERKSRAGCVLISLVVLSILYVLSPPFMEIVLVRGPAPVRNFLWDFLPIVYGPLRWLYENVEAFQDYYDWYLAWIEKLF